MNPPNLQIFLGGQLMRKKSALLFFAFILGISGCQKCQRGAPEGTTIRIGEVGSMTGSEATFGTSTHNGVMLAIEEVNSAGGIGGKKLEVIALDDQGKPEEAATATTRLATQDRVIAILGEVASSRSIAMAPIAQANKVPMVSPSSTNPKVTELGDYIFRVCFIDPFQGMVMARFAKEHLKAQNVAILTDVKNDYSIGLAEFFEKTFVTGGGKIVVKQSYSAGDIDFNAQLTSIKNAQPPVQAIFVPGYYTEVGLIASQARTSGLNVPLLGGDGWDSPKLFEISQNKINGYYSNHYSAEDQTPAVQNFIKNYEKTYGSIPDGLAAMGYDAAMVLVDAIKRAKTVSSEAIRDALADTKNYPGVTGSITIDDKRNPVKSAVVLKVANGTTKYQTTVAP